MFMNQPVSTRCSRWVTPVVKTLFVKKLVSVTNFGTIFKICNTSLGGVQEKEKTLKFYSRLLKCHVASFCLQLAKDLLHPTLDEEKRKHKKKRLVQSPNSYFMDVKCPGM